MEIEVGQIYQRKATGRKGNRITNARSQYYGRYIEFEVTEISGDSVTYQTLHPIWGYVERTTKLKRFLKIIKPTIEMQYQKHPHYKLLSKDEKKFLDSHMLRMKEDFRSRDQDDEFLKEADQFPHPDSLKLLYLNSDEEGKIMDTIKPTTKADKTVRPPKEAKDTYSGGAYRRWKKNGLLSEDGKTATINGVQYLLSREGKKYKLTKQ